VLITDERVQMDWQLQFSGVYSIMMVNSAQSGEDWGCTPSPFHSIYHHVTINFVVYAPIYPLPFILCGADIALVSTKFIIAH
jgi:hypothetical protein